MATLRVPPISKAYLARGGGRHPLRRPRTALNRFAPASPRRRHHHALSAPSVAPSNRYINATNQLARPARYISSLISPDDDDGDESKRDDDGDDDSGDGTGNIDSLTAAIEALRQVGAAETGDNANDTASEESDAALSAVDRSDGGKRNLLDALKSSPFESSLASPDTSSSISDDTPGSSAGTSAGSTPSLSELLQMDIFSESRAEAEKVGSGPPPTSSYGSGQGRRSDYMSDFREGSSSSMWSSPSTSAPSLISSWDENEPSGSGYGAAQREPSPAQLKYNKLLEQTDALLDSLSKDDEASTLQLMDFDKVMNDWSRFHAEVDSAKQGGEEDEYDVFGSGRNGTAGDSLKQKASDQCMKLLDALERNYDSILDDGENLPQTKHTRLMPNAASYNLALHTLAHSDKGQSVAQEAFSILTRMLDRCQKYMDREDVKGDVSEERAAWAKLPRPPPEPSTITYNSVLHAIAKSDASDAGHLAEEAFAKMEQWRSQCAGSDTYKGVHPNSRTLACVLDAWNNAKTTMDQSYGPERAEAILDVAIERRRAYVEAVTGNDHVRDNFEKIEDSAADFNEQDDTYTFTDDNEIIEETVCEEGMESTDDGAAEEDSTESQQEDTTPLQEAKSSLLLRESTPPLRPNTVAFNTCIHAWASSGRGREGARRAQELLIKFETITASGELDLPREHPDENTVDDGDDVLESDLLLKPNVRTYATVMNAWANVSKVERGSGEDAAAHCEDILSKMEDKGAFDASLRPNLAAYVTSISAWARTREVAHAASRAEHILNRMIDLYYGEEGTELPHLDGDVENPSHDAPFNAVITAYARSSDPNATDRALAVLERLEASPIIPTATTYNAVIDVCAKHGEPERAIDVLNMMKNVSISPDSTSYDTVLNAFARNEEEGSAEKAYDFLCRLEEERSSGEITNFVPSSTSYSAVINAFARTSGKEHGGLSTVKRAKQIYDKLIAGRRHGAIHGEADSFANSCLLNCCANMHGTSAEKKEALITAINAFEEMKQKPDLHGEPSHYTFGTMIKACSRLSSDEAEKHRLMEHLFIQAVKRGNCSKAVMAQFLRNTPSHLSMKLILSLGGSKRDIPQSWHSNVPRRQWPTPPDRNDHDFGHSSW